MGAKKFFDIQELKLLAAISYAEASLLNVYEEMAGIASAVVRKRDAMRVSSVNQLITKYPNYSSVVNNGNKRFAALLQHEPQGPFLLAYQAAQNALDYGPDFSGGGCFWDGEDLKLYGIKHYRYRSPQGFRFTKHSHNIFHINEPPPYHIKTKYGHYSYVYESTGAFGKTIFWKYAAAFLIATGTSQCC